MTVRVRVNACAVNAHAAKGASGTSPTQRAWSTPCRSPGRGDAWYVLLPPKVRAWQYRRGLV